MMQLFDPGGLPEELRDRHPMEAAYLRQFAEVASQELIRNVVTTVKGMALGDTLAPITVDSPRPDNCYVVSPASAYSEYARYELQVLPNPMVKAALRAVIAAFARWCRRVGLDRVVHVNNWMLSTNLYDGWTGEDLAAVTGALRERFEDNAIVFRSLNPYSNAGLLDRMRECGYLLLPSRQIYIQDARGDQGRVFSGRRDFKQDGRLFRETGYRIEKPDDSQVVFERLEHLYNQLYLKKYTPLNPQFTSRWLRNGHQDGWLNLFCLVSQPGQIDGVAGILRRGSVMSTPVFGYDTTRPQSIGLYRMLSWICTDAAIRSHLVFNCSAGAAGFKRSRGAVPCIEYSAVYIKHLDVERKLAWHLLSRLLNGVAAPLLRRYAL